MDMTIGEVIREKRKELELTQEQVAQRLGISAPAVNKWERGSTYPDITILPALARLLNTDINTLLCFQEEVSDEEAARICSEIVEIMEADGADAAFRAAEQKLREYPNCGKLIYRVAVTMQGLTMISGDWSISEETYRTKIYSWYERVLECIGDERLKDSASYMLAGNYIQNNEYEKAQEMLNSLPEQGTDKRMLKARLLLKQEKNDEAAVLLERMLMELTSVGLYPILSMLLEIACREDDLERAEKIASIGRQSAVLFEQWGYSPLILPMELAVKRKDAEKSIEYIREMLKMLTEPPHMSQSVLFCHIYSRKERAKYDQALKAYAEKILPALVTEMKSNEEYSFLWENEEFQKMTEKVSEHFGTQ